MRFKSLQAQNTYFFTKIQHSHHFKDVKLLKINKQSTTDFLLTKTGNAADKTGEKSIKWKRSNQAAVDELN